MPDASGTRRDTAHFVNAIKQPLIANLLVFAPVTFAVNIPDLFHKSGIFIV